MSKNERGCLGLVFSTVTVLIQFPLFCLLLYGIMQSIAPSPPQWVWVILWAYIPVGTLLGTLRGVVEAIITKEQDQ